jgi:hypothetical protein
MFPLAFPYRLLTKASAEDWVFDPFCGRGTTMLAARLHGLPSVGIDSNPVAAAVAGVKLTGVTPSEIKALAVDLLADHPDGLAVPRGEFWDRCYHPDTLREVCSLRARLLERCRSQAEVALRAIVLGILHGPVNKQDPTYLSNQMPRTYSTKPDSAVRFWKKRKMRPARVPVLDAIGRRADYVLAGPPPAVPGRVLRADSRSFRLSPGHPRFRWVITSPPYYGMRSYFPDQWLRNWFVGGPDAVCYDRTEQISHHSGDEFVGGLAAVWRRTAAACDPGARMVVRFGALPSESKDPRRLLSDSLVEADCGWRVTTVKNAGTARRGRRQYEQFGPTPSDPVEEIDLYAVLGEG